MPNIAIRDTTDKARMAYWRHVTAKKWPLYKCPCGNQMRSDFPFKTLFCSVCMAEITREDLKP